MWSPALNSFLLVTGPHLRTNTMFPQLFLAEHAHLALAWERTQLVLYSVFHTRKATFAPHVGFRREQLTTPWEVISHDWYFRERDT